MEKWKRGKKMRKEDSGPDDGVINVKLAPSVTKIFGPQQKFQVS
jgi:hypothetical protein